MFDTNGFVTDSKLEGYLAAFETCCGPRADPATSILEWIPNEKPHRDLGGALWLGRVLSEERKEGRKEGMKRGRVGRGRLKTCPTRVGRRGW